MADADAAAPGRLLRIFLRPAARAPVREVERVEARAGEGLAGDHRKGGRRQVTLLTREGWAAACADLGVTLDPGGRRANLLVEGVDLATALGGGRVRIGPVEVEVAGETTPCQLMDDVHPGLWSALKPEARGGVFGRLLASGTLEVGAPVEVLPATAPGPPAGRGRLTGA